ncbi:MAG: peptidyl-prolyl cis-trans isomerase [Gemmatimonadetes bacterium]|nr:peptidyl-prolyl cis-trans isomerase [Gemmatimonadota bacterium]
MPASTRPVARVSRPWPQRLIVGALLLASAGCRDHLLQAREAVVVDAAGARITGAQFEHLLATAKSGSVQSNAAFYTSTWIDYALLAAAERDRWALDDSATVDAAIWPDVALSVVRQRRERLAVARQTAPKAVLDSLYQSDSLRVFQHVMIRVRLDAPDSIAAAARRRLEVAAERVAKGEPFAKVARELSEDQSAADGGFLPANTPGALSPVFERAAWGLAPGSTTNGVRTAFGWHLIRRPPQSEVERQLQAFAARKATTGRERARRDSLGRAAKVQAVPGANALVRALATEPGTIAGADTIALATFTGGRFTAARMREWMGSMPHDMRLRWSKSSDKLLDALLNEMVLNELELRAEGVTQPPADARRTLRPTYLEGLAKAREALVRPAAGDTTLSARTLALFERFSSGRTRYRALPGALGMVLRGRYAVKINRDAIAEIVETVSSLQAKADTTRPFIPNDGAFSQPIGALP